MTVPGAGPSGRARAAPRPPRRPSLADVATRRIPVRRSCASRASISRDRSWTSRSSALSSGRSSGCSTARGAAGRLPTRLRGAAQATAAAAAPRACRARPRARRSRGRSWRSGCSRSAAPHGLPRPLVNHPSCWHRGRLRLRAAACSSRPTAGATTAAAPQFERDRERDGIFARAGYRVLRFTDDRSSASPAAVAATIAAALRVACVQSRHARCSGRRAPPRALSAPRAPPPSGCSTPSTPPRRGRRRPSPRPASPTSPTGSRGGRGRRGGTARRGRG